jgi:hypothetical protein
MSEFDLQIVTLFVIGNSHSVINFEGIVHLLHRETIAYTNILPRHPRAAGKSPSRLRRKDSTEGIRTTARPIARLIFWTNQIVDDALKVQRTRLARDGRIDCSTANLVA